MSAEGEPPVLPRPPVAPVGPSCWWGPEVACGSWRRTWTPGAIDALLSLVDVVDATDPAALEDLGGTVEIPPALAEVVDQTRAELLHGPGFTVWTGFPVDRLDAETAARAYVVLGALLGSLRSQNARGHLLGHVRNVGAEIASPTTRIYQTDRRQTFHTDSCDAVSLLCLQPAEEGGRSLLVSAEAAYHEVRRRRPDLADRLFDVVATDRRGERPPGEQDWFEIPVLTWYDHRLTPLYQRQYIDAAERFADAPALDEQQVEALDLFDAVMNDPDVHLAIDFEPGDMQFVNNHALLHDRTAFVDAPGRPRHLLRLWIALPGARPLPDRFAQRYGSVTVGDRGGIRVADTELRVALTAES